MLFSELIFSSPLRYQNRFQSGLLICSDPDNSDGGAIVIRCAGITHRINMNNPPYLQWSGIVKELGGKLSTKADPGSLLLLCKYRQFSFTVPGPAAYLW